MTVTFSGARILEQVMDVSLNLDQNKANCESANKKTCGGTELEEKKTSCICTIMYPLSFEPNCYIHLKQINK